jgi:DNA repair exonuclease SbcCD ATPase subunit
VLFRRIAVRNFRKLVSLAVIDGLAQGVTIIAGDNEEGKSTLLLAIRAGLFERHNLGGKAVEAMQPFGSSVRPEITLDFEIEGEDYSITKGFAQRPSALLITPHGRFEGPVADERLAQLLTFRVPPRGESRPDDRGILGLFWLEQAHVVDGLGFGEIGRSTLRSSLEQEVGDVLGGNRGCQLLEMARAKRDSLLTATGRARGELAAAVDAVETATARVATLEGERRSYDQEIDDLAKVRRELTRIDTDKVLEKSQEALASAEEHARAVEKLREQDEAAGLAMALAEAQAENAKERQTQRLALIQTAIDREEALRNAQATVIELEKETERLVRQLEAARATFATVIEARGAAERRVALSQSWARAKTLDDEIADLDRRLIEVDQLALELAAGRDRLTGIKIDKRAFEEIQRHEAAMREARAGLKAIATRVYFSPTGAQKVIKGVRRGDPSPRKHRGN